MPYYNQEKVAVNNFVICYWKKLAYGKELSMTIFMLNYNILINV